VRSGLFRTHTCLTGLARSLDEAEAAREGTFFNTRGLVVGTRDRSPL
jgi:hypothetical protein